MVSAKPGRYLRRRASSACRSAQASSPLVASAVVALLLLGSACSGRTYSATNARPERATTTTTATSSRSHPRQTTTTDVFAHGIPSTTSTAPVPPPRPGSPGAAGLASVETVVRLHALAVAAYDNRQAAPPGAIGGQARDVANRMTALATELAARAKGDQSARRLAETLRSYAAVARGLGGVRLPSRMASRAQLKTLDAAWKAALAAVDRTTGSRVAGTVPPLPLPATSTVADSAPPTP